jgi:hypothetical protein
VPRRSHPTVFALFSQCKNAAARVYAAFTGRESSGNRDLERCTAVTRFAPLALVAATLLAVGSLSGTAAAARADHGGGGHGKPESSSHGGRPADDERGGGGSGQGIVQSVSAIAVVLRELDGSTLSVPVDSKTRVVIDGKQGSLRDLKPGYVALASWKSDGPAPVLQVFTAGVTVVASISGGTVTLTRPDGSTASITVGPKTRILVDGRPASLGDVQPGYILVPRPSKGRKTGGELAFLRPV